MSNTSRTQAYIHIYSVHACIYDHIRSYMFMHRLCTYVHVTKTEEDMNLRVSGSNKKNMKERRLVRNDLNRLFMNQLRNIGNISLYNLLQKPVSDKEYILNDKSDIMCCLLQLA